MGAGPLSVGAGLALCLAWGRLGAGFEGFLIDGAGMVRRVWRKVRVKGHAAEVLAAVQSL